MVNSISSQVPRARLVGDMDTSRSVHGAAGGPAGTRGTVDPVTPGDSLRLSAGAGQLPASLTQGPPVDAALVDRLGTAIAEGRYPVDPDRIAAALFRDYLDFQA